MKRHALLQFTGSLAAACLLIWAGAARGAVDLRWSPGDTTVVTMDAPVRLAIHLDEALHFRTIEVTVRYDTTVVQSLGGGPGALFTDSGLFVFDGFEEAPGSWHAFAIIMGAEDHLTGPGELLHWNIQGRQPGLSSVTSVEVNLYDEASPPHPIEEVLLEDEVILVRDNVSGVGDLPQGGTQLQLAPNPFNPRTRVSFTMPGDGWARLSVFDVRGRQVAVLHEGFTAAGLLEVDWDGTDERGLAQPGGVYLFQLRTGGVVSTRKGLLLK